MKDYLEEISGIRSIVLLGGIAGGIIALSLSRVRSYPEAFITFLAGVSASVFFTPFVDHFIWKVPDPSLYGGVAFILGLTGRELSRFAYRWVVRLVKRSQVDDTER